jgi:predicted anti-sigma-YlaC factor YlaD
MVTGEAATAGGLLAGALESFRYQDVIGTAVPFVAALAVLVIVLSLAPSWGAGMIGRIRGAL